MPDMEHEHPVTFRKETAEAFFERFVKAGESCIMVGVAGGGLRRFVDFLMREDVQQHYLGSISTESPEIPLLLNVDCTRIHEVSEWGLDELMLTALVEGCNMHPQAVPLQAEINQLRMDVITSHNPLLAQRHLELAVDIVVRRANLRLYFVLNEFDDVFKSLPDLGLNHLRALRDSHKYQVNFVLCLRRFPDQLRPVLSDMLSARIAQNLLVVGPYSLEDANRMIEQLEARKNCPLSDPVREQILRLSGRHAGLIQGLFTSLCANPTALDDSELISRLLEQRSAAALECERLWNGLSEEEQEGLRKLAHGSTLPLAPLHWLESKCLVDSDGARPRIFSPLFAQFVRQKSGAEQVRLWVDEDTHVIHVGTRVISDLSPRVFKLVAYLFRNRNRLCHRDDIFNEVYPGEQDVSDAALASLIKQARQQLEPDDEPYRFLKTRRGFGYMLLDTPEVAESAND